MALNFPNLDQIISRSRADIQSSLPNSNPYLPDSMLNAIAVSDSGRIKEMYDQLLIIKQDSLITTAGDSALDDKGAVYGMSLNPATQAEGTVIFIGTSGIPVNVGTALQSSTGESYTTQTSVTMVSQAKTLSSLTRSGSIVTGTTSTEHNLGSGMTVTIAGANEIEYNGDYEITVTTLYDFEYTISTTPATPATGTITATYIGGTTTVVSDDEGDDQNITGGTLTITSPITGIEDTVYTTYIGLDGGTDIETYEEFRVRLLERIQLPNTPYNATEIKLTAKEVSGVTRVWVYQPGELTATQTPTSITCFSNGYALVTVPVAHDLLDGAQITVSGANEAPFNGSFAVLIPSATTMVYYSATLTTGDSPATGTLVVNYDNIQLGQTKIFFVRDNDASIIPTSGEIEDVCEAILAIKPANTDDDDVIVEAPTENSIAFTFTALNPNTVDMQISITTNLEALFIDTDLGATITADAYRTAIFNSYDTNAGQGMNSFTLSVPSGDITNEYNEIATIGIITYP